MRGLKSGLNLPKVLILFFQNVCHSIPFSVSSVEMNTLTSKGPCKFWG